MVLVVVGWFISFLAEGIELELTVLLLEAKDKISRDQSSYIELFNKMKT